MAAGAADVGRSLARRCGALMEVVSRADAASGSLEAAPAGTMLGGARRTREPLCDEMLGGAETRLLDVLGGVSGFGDRFTGSSRGGTLGNGTPREVRLGALDRRAGSAGGREGDSAARKEERCAEEERGVEEECCVEDERGEEGDGGAADRTGGGVERTGAERTGGGAPGATLEGSSGGSSPATS